MLSIAMLVAGLILLGGGGELVVRGASRIATALGMSPLAVGLTVVAFGTSAPELAVNVIGAVEGSTAVAFGNVVGSNLANIGLILGLAALVRPVGVHREVISREGPMASVTLVALIAIQLDPELGEGVARVDRIDGLVLLVFFAVFLYYTAVGVLRDRPQRRGRRSPEEAGERGESGAGLIRELAGPGLLVLGGLVCLVAGGEGAVRGAVGIARAIGLSESVIGMTIVAVGTSLPELASTLIAARRGHSDLAIGNIVGSNIFNTTLILGATAVITPVEVPPGGRGDLLATLLITVLLLVCSGRKLGLVQKEGALLFGSYLIYVTARVALGTA